jgi:hypothetical protein
VHVEIGQLFVRIRAIGVLAPFDIDWEGAGL